MELRAMVGLGAWNGVPRDTALNNFCFNANDLAGFQAIATALKAFYNNAPEPGLEPISDFLSGSVSRNANACFIKLYDLEATGSPVYEETWTLNPIEVGHKNLPAESGVRLSFNANLDGIPEEGPPDPVTGKITRPRARRRGGVTIGPLNDKCFAEGVDSGNDQKVSLAFRNILAMAAVDLASDPNTSWRVWSEKEQVSRVVIGGFVDNAFDQSIRRGHAASARTNWSV